MMETLAFALFLVVLVGFVFLRQRRMWRVQLAAQREVLERQKESLAIQREGVQLQRESTRLLDVIAKALERH